MESALKIRNYEEKDRQRILQLHQDSIEPITLDKYPLYQTALEQRLVPDQTVIAEVQGEVEGFVSFERFDQQPYKNLMHLTYMLTIAQLPKSKSNVRNYLKKVCKDLGKGEVTLQYFDLAQKINNFGVPADSIMGTNMVVSEKYQSNGVGYTLAHHALETVLQRQPPMIFTQLLDGSPSVSICEKLGFRSLFRYGPNYSNGAATHLMVYDPLKKL